ncbi:MAG: DUF559 domain-containing protein [Bacteroidota bacterium]
MVFERGGGGEYMNCEDAKDLARSLRRNQTREEGILWQNLRNRKLSGFKFLRQHPITYDEGGKRFFFIADFYCHSKKLVVEVDGKIHDLKADYDEQRDLIMKEMELVVIRITNDEVNNNLNEVLEKIKSRLTHP